MESMRWSWKIHSHCEWKIVLEAKQLNFPITKGITYSDELTGCLYWYIRFHKIEFKHLKLQNYDRIINFMANTFRVFVNELLRDLNDLPVISLRKLNKYRSSSREQKAWQKMIMAKKMIIPSRKHLFDWGIKKIRKQ